MAIDSDNVYVARFALTTTKGEFPDINVREGRFLKRALGSGSPGIIRLLLYPPDNEGMGAPPYSERKGADISVLASQVPYDYKKAHYREALELVHNRALQMKDHGIMYENALHNIELQLVMARKIQPKLPTAIDVLPLISLPAHVVKTVL